jgi:MFS family permease
MLKSVLDSLTHPRISRRLRVRLWIFFIIALGLIAYIGWDVWRGYAAWWMALIAFIVGGAIGAPLGRMRSVEWHEEREEVISRMDLTGAIAIVVYIVLDSARDWLLGYWFSGVALTTIAFAAVAGLLVGRMLGMQVSIRRVLEAQGH